MAEWLDGFLVFYLHCLVTQVTKIARLITGDPTAEVAESTRLALRLAFSALSIVIISAGLEWQCERAVNEGLRTYADAVYFSFTIVTTVGLGDIVPVTANGRLVLVAEMVAAVTVSSTSHCLGVPRSASELVGASD